VSALSGLSHLRELGLAGTPIRDVSALGSLTQLERLNLSNTAIPREQVEVLNSKLPECQIEYSPRPIA
jgi:hypothetical protein